MRCHSLGLERLFSQFPSSWNVVEMAAAGHVYTAIFYTNILDPIRNLSDFLLC